MSIHIGGLDLTDTVINLEFRMGVMERLMDKMTTFVPSGAITQADVEAMRAEVMKDLQKRFPDLGITPKTKNG
jgi:hypothetical protein